MNGLFKRLFASERKEEDLKREKEKLQIRTVAEKSGWSCEDAAKRMRAAREKMGISCEEYLQLEMYSVPESMQPGTYQRYLNHKANREEQRERCIVETMQNRSCSREEAVCHLDAAMERWELRYSDYLEYDFCRLEEPEQEKAYQVLSAEKARKKEERAVRLRQERASVVERVMEKTGWDRKTTRENIKKAKDRTGCSYEEYLLYRFYELDEKTQDEIFLTEFSHKLAVKYVASREFGRMLCDKAATNRFFSECVKRPWCLNKDIGLEEFCKIFADCKKIVYKPLGGNWGRGVVGFAVQDNLRQIYDQVASYPEGVVEQFVIQHPQMCQLSPTAVNTVRIGTISSTTMPVTAEGKMVDVAYASLKIGGVTSEIVDNLHGGGMVAGIDLQTGTLITDGADSQGNLYEVHPVTGTRIKGFRIPYFKEAVEMVVKAAAEKKLNGYLGWDVAITENGPELIEANQLPGAILVSLPYIAEKKGMKPIMEKYL